MVVHGVRNPQCHLYCINFRTSILRTVCRATLGFFDCICSSFFLACFRVYLRELRTHFAEVEVLKGEIADLKVNLHDEHRRRGEKILSEMTPGKTWKLAELATLSEMSEDETLEVLDVLTDRDKVIPVDVDEEPRGTFWRRV